MPGQFDRAEGGPAEEFVEAPEEALIATCRSLREQGLLN